MSTLPREAIVSVPLMSHQKGELKSMEFKIERTIIDATHAGKNTKPARTKKSGYDHQSDDIFIGYLKLSGVWDKFVSECPLEYLSNNAPGPVNNTSVLILLVPFRDIKDILITAIRSDNVNPQLWEMQKVMSRLVDEL